MEAVVTHRPPAHTRCCAPARNRTGTRRAGAPTLAQHGGAVGATDLLSADAGEVLATDLGQGDNISLLATHVEGLLSDGGRLARVGAAACRKARGWTERANAEQLTLLLEGLQGGNGGW